MYKLTADRIKGAEFARNIFRVVVPHGVKYEEILQPIFWAHVASQFAGGDKIEARAENGAWYAELLVLDSSRLHAKVGVLNHVVFDETVDEATEPEAEVSPFSAEFKGPQRLWALIRRKDKEVVKEKFSSKEEANSWLSKNIASLG